MGNRRVLEGVPKVAFAPIHDGKWEFTPYPSCLKSVLGFLGHPIPYHSLLGSSGAAFRLMWHTQKWEPGAVDIVFMDPDPTAPMRRALDFAGCDYEMLFNSTVKWDELTPDAVRACLSPVFEDCEEAFRERIVASIDAGKPLISFGVVGPPEASIIAGYDGEFLIGWSMFQEHLDPAHDISEDSDEGPHGYEESGYFRRRDWFRRLHGIILLKEQHAVYLEEEYRKALKLIPGIVTNEKVGEFYNGQRAYREYIDKILDDSEFEGVADEGLGLRKIVHYDAMTMIAEREGGALFVRDMARHPAFEQARADLQAASDAFLSANQEMHGWWKVVGEIWSDEAAQVKATADPGVRRAFAPYIERSMAADRKAVDLLTEADEKLGIG